MDNTFISLYRKSINSRVFRNEGLWKVWTWCLLKASYKERWVTMKTGKSEIEIKILPGQFVFGRFSAGKELKMKPETVRTRIAKLEKMQNITTDPTRQYTIISIVNWDTYQVVEKNNTTEDTNRTPGKHQANTTNKKVNKVNNGNKQLLGEFKIPSFIPENYLFQENHLKYSLSKKLSKEQAEDQFEAFVIHHKAKGSKFKSWSAAFQNWIRNSIKFGNVVISISQPGYIPNQAEIDDQNARFLE